jgi:hypothetical protein
METIKTFDAGKFVIEVINRGKGNQKYPDHEFAAILKELRPKAKYSPVKILWHYVYKTLPDAENKALETFTTLTDRQKEKAEHQAAKKAARKEVKASDHYELGDIIVNTWGYDQTNVDFYQVTKLTTKTIEVKEIGQKIEERTETSNGMSCNVLPDVNSFIVDGDCYNLRVYENGNLSNPKSHYYMRKWSGKSQYCSWYA